MPWTTPEPGDPEEVRIARERKVIRDAVPTGWALHYNRLTYGFELAGAGGTGPLYGVCGHGYVCLSAGEWRHPYPLTPGCDQPPMMTHSGIW